MNTNFVRQKVDSLNVQVKEFRFNILALKIRFRSKLLQNFSRQKSPEKREKIFLKRGQVRSVLRDLAICRHLGYFFNHLATSILIWRLRNLATFWATF